MKHFILIIFLSNFCNIKSQDTTYSYFNAKWKKTSKENFTFYRKSFKNEQKEWVANDYYASGKLQMTGVFNNKKLKKKNGLFTYYFENGNKKSEGQYLKNNQNGEWKNWSEDNSIDYVGTYLIGKKEGIWKWYFQNGQVSSEETYHADELITFTFWNENGTNVGDNPIIEEQCQFIGGADSMYSYLSREITYPELARSAGINGRVYVKFVINKDGSIGETEITRSVHKLLDKEALRVVNSMPNWSPGKQHNRYVSVWFTLPIRFNLE